MTAARRGKPLSRDGNLTHEYTLRTPLMAVLAWAVVAFLCVSTLTPVSGDPSAPSTEGHMLTPNLCWETQGPHELECFHAEPLAAETYPLTPEMLESALSRYTTTDLSLHRAFHRARKRGVLKVVVLGGSVTYGHECKSPAGLANQRCAWPNRLQQWFDERIDDFKVEVINGAVPTYTILNYIHNLYHRLPVDMEVDLIIVDFGVNDAIIELFDFDMNNAKFSHEVFIRYVRNEMVHMPALLYAETFISPARVGEAPRQASNMADIHAAVTSKYDIPMASFRDAVWPHLEDSAMADRLWGTEVHPDWQVQQLLADVVVYCIQKSYARFLEEYGLLSNPSPLEKGLVLFERKNVCCMADERSFILDAGALVGRPPPQEQVESVGWFFGKDTSGRQGLIGFGNSSQEAIVSFDLRCAGARQVLHIAYLRSYRGMGAVRVVVRRADTDLEDPSAHDSYNEIVVLDGLWKTQASILGYAAIPTPSDLGKIRVTFEILSADTEASYSSLLNDIVGSNFNGVRLHRKFVLAQIQC